MDNVNQPPGRDPQDNPPTQPYRFTPGWPGGAGDSQYPGPPGSRYGYEGQDQGQYQAGGNPHQTGGHPYQAGDHYQAGHYQGGQYPPNPPGAQYPPAQPGGKPPRGGIMHRKLRWTAGVAAAVLLAAGGTLIGLHLTSHGGTATPTANTATASALNGELTALSSPACSHTKGSGSSTSSSSTSASSTSASKGACRSRAHLLRLIHGMYGQVAFNTTSGTQTLAFERGTIQSVSNGQLVVKAKNGTTWTWTVDSSSVIKQNSKTASSTALFNGDKVFVAGPESGSTKDARAILIHTASSGSGSKSSSQSSSTSSAA
ncbi:MAG TPA: hypothetical protein VGH27_34455 [Streptosporangiaceae bacterium]|jgi:hypothetical protein